MFLELRVLYEIDRDSRGKIFSRKQKEIFTIGTMIVFFLTHKISFVLKHFKEIGFWCLLYCKFYKTRHLILSLSGTKNGDCPNMISVYFQCGGSCHSDSDCPRAQRCCSASPQCDDRQCLDPVGLAECVYDGVLYPIGQTFQPHPCTECICHPDRSTGDVR